MKRKRHYIPKNIGYFEQRSEERVNGCILWTGCVNANGYGRFSDGSTDGKPVTKLAHRAIYELFLGQVPNGIEVCHSCDTPACINVAHLFLGTHADNMADMSGKRRQTGNLGVFNHNAKLNETDVLKIRHSQLSHTELAKIYDVTAQCIYAVRSYRTWKNVA